PPPPPPPPRPPPPPPPPAAPGSPKPTASCASAARTAESETRNEAGRNKSRPPLPFIPYPSAFILLPLVPPVPTGPIPLRPALRRALLRVPALAARPQLLPQPIPGRRDPRRAIHLAGALPVYPHRLRLLAGVPQHPRVYRRLPGDPGAGVARP